MHKKTYSMNYITKRFYIKDGHGITNLDPIITLDEQDLFQSRTNTIWQTNYHYIEWRMNGNFYFAQTHLQHKGRSLRILGHTARATVLGLAMEAEILLVEGVITHDDIITVGEALPARFNLDDIDDETFALEILNRDTEEIFARIMVHETRNRIYERAVS
jgi:hypothetical protein